MSKHELEGKFNPKDFEDEIYENWEKKGYFKPSNDKSKKPYTIVIPPPNITGRLHMGHALDETLQDILIRYKRMAGFNALWVPGTDHASIATEAKIVAKLKEEGITLVLDDYGTGYSNAYRLSNLTPHYIKIDRVLTQKALSSNYERSILIYIIEMAHSLRLNVCIEGVETEEELQEIKKLNPDYIQGYLFGKPVPEDEFYNRQIKKK